MIAGIGIMYRLHTLGYLIDDRLIGVLVTEHRENHIMGATKISNDHTSPARSQKAKKMYIND